MAGMPRSPIEGVSVFFATYCPPGFQLRGGTSIHTAHSFTVAREEDFLVEIARRAADSCQKAYRDLGLVTSIAVESEGDGWRVTFHESMYCADQTLGEMYDDVAQLVPWTLGE